MKTPTLDRFVSRLYILKFVKARPATVLNLVDRLREHGIDKNIRSLRPILRSLMIARAITAELVEGSGRVYCITEQGRAELDRYLAHLDILQSERGNEPSPGQGREDGG
ncbi:transcriptional regulator [Cupriavidus sp. USMAA2-4]|uniref:Transcriptional regulator n=1 Tax=Cupriavidus malaysiensis TaxID=367825 RepID=A0ABN4TXY9_9BURK|nr:MULTISPECIES: helix-turn-helix transcriptional regulator [Cupriavidus]AOY94765.1 transcriptional regulator [Cupriavidus sp. USMAA2-4]AOZ02374.1 transcriptional regulator [Cupriavidus sp. USMAHM13]AOZ10253.1 transcriptional regulator [Cupriavidus malaysiensis]